jgi:hypothetical protein
LWLTVCVSSVLGSSHPVDMETVSGVSKMQCLPHLGKVEVTCISKTSATYPNVHCVTIWEQSTFYVFYYIHRGPLSLVSTIEELLGRKSSGSSLENREYGRRDAPRRPRGTLYPQKSALISPTSGGRSAGIVGSWIQATDFSFFFIISILLCILLYSFFFLIHHVFFSCWCFLLSEAFCPIMFLWFHFYTF